MSLNKLINLVERSMNIYAQAAGGAYRRHYAKSVLGSRSYGTPKNGLSIENVHRPFNNVGTTVAHCDNSLLTHV